jgi:hypothetical protein
MLGQRSTIAQRAERRLQVLLGLLCALPVAALAIGLRTGARRRRRRDGGTKVRLPTWLPIIRRRDLLALTLLGLAAGVAFTFAWRDIDEGVRYAGVPVPALSDGFAAPAVQDWLKASVEPGTARDEWLAYAHSEAVAASQGGRAEGALPPSRFADVLAQPPPLGQELATLVGRVDRPVTGPSASVWLVPFASPIRAAVLSLLLLLGGCAVGARLPRIADILSRLMPGGSASLGFGTSLVAALGTTGALIALGARVGLADALIPANPSYLPLALSASPPVLFARGLGVDLIAAALILEALGVLRDLRQSRAARPPVAQNQMAA